MKIFVFIALIFSFYTSVAEDVIRIEVGKNHRKYSDREMRQRIWQLERAVFQLQNRIFQLEGRRPVQVVNTADSWICTTGGLGQTYSGTGGSKAVAKSRAIEKCSKKMHDSFFCKDVKCEK